MTDATGPQAAKPAVPFTQIFSWALQGQRCDVVGMSPAPTVLPMHEWSRCADADDHRLVSLCRGSTIDVGCGPGRLTVALADLGHVALGVDVVSEAVDQTRERGALAILRDVFQSVPGEGRWRTGLLADGNIGIGGDPVRLLARVRQILDPRGRIVVELGPPGTGFNVGSVHLECNGESSRPFAWAEVGVDAIDRLAAQSGLRVMSTHQYGKRWFAALEERR